MAIGKRTTQPLGVAMEHKRLHYKGDCTGQGLEGQILGPNGLGEYFVIVNVQFSERTNRSTAFVRPARSEDLRLAVSV